MPITNVKFIPTTPLTNTSTSYGAPVATGVVQIIKKAVFSNTGTAPRTITVNLVPLNSSATLANQIINPNERTLRAGETYVSPELAGMVMVAGDLLFMNASASTDVNVTISGSRIS